MGRVVKRVLPSTPYKIITHLFKKYLERDVWEETYLNDYLWETFKKGLALYNQWTLDFTFGQISQVSFTNVANYISPYIIPSGVENSLLIGGFNVTGYMST